MLDHLTGGRLEIGTSAGIPNEMEKVGLGVDEARARNDELVDILDKALAQPVISHHGKFWSFHNLRLTPRCVQQPSPPKWVTVVSVSSARKAARRGARITTGFHPQIKVKEIFDAYREEADKAGLTVGPDHLGLRRRVSLLDDDRKAEEVVARQRIEFSPAPAFRSPSRHTRASCRSRHANRPQLHDRGRRVHRRDPGHGRQADHRTMSFCWGRSFPCQLRPHVNNRSPQGLVPSIWQGSDPVASKHNALLGVEPKQAFVGQTEATDGCVAFKLPWADASCSDGGQWSSSSDR